MARVMEVTVAVLLELPRDLFSSPAADERQFDGATIRVITFLGITLLNPQQISAGHQTGYLLRSGFLLVGSTY